MESWLRFAFSQADEGIISLRGNLPRLHRPADGASRRLPRAGMHRDDPILIVIQKGLMDYIALCFAPPQTQVGIVTLGRYAAFFQRADDRAARGLPRAGMRRDDPILIVIQKGLMD
jgi:hypothetical protein